MHIPVRELRLKAGIGQRELGRRMGVTPKVAAKWDKGSQPRSDKLPKLVQVLGLNSIEELYRT